VVQLSRRSPLHKFVVQGIKSAPLRPSKVSKGAVLAAQEAAAVENSNTPTHRLTGPKSGGWLARLFAKSADTRSTILRQVVASDQAATSPTPALIRHDANEYNWTSFLCPYCNASGFVHCRGGHFACDGTAEARSGRRFHQCYCGNAGFIEGTIKTIDANHSVLQAARAAATAKTQQSAEVTKEPGAMNLLSPM
jgi:hypothetical protein